MPEANNLASSSQPISTALGSQEARAWLESIDRAIDELAQAERRVSKALTEQASRYQSTGQAYQNLQAAAQKVGGCHEQETNQSLITTERLRPTPLAQALRTKKHNNHFSYDVDGWQQFNYELQKAKRKLHAFYTIHIESNGIKPRHTPVKPVGSDEFFNKKLARYIRRLKSYALQQAINDLTNKAVDDEELANTELLIEHNKHLLFRRAFEQQSLSKQQHHNEQLQPQQAQIIDDRSRQFNYTKQYLVRSQNIDQTLKERLSPSRRRQLARVRSTYSPQQLQLLVNNSIDLAELDERVNSALLLISKKPFQESKLVEQALNESPSLWNPFWWISDKWRDHQKPLVDYTRPEKQLRLIRAKEVLTNTYHVSFETIKQQLNIDSSADGFSVRYGQLTLDEAIHRLEQAIIQQRVATTYHELHQITSVFKRLSQTVQSIVYKVVPNGYRDFNDDHDFANSLQKARRNHGYLSTLGLLANLDQQSATDAGPGNRQQSSADTSYEYAFEQSIQNKLANNVVPPSIKPLVESDNQGLPVNFSRQQLMRELNRYNNNCQAAIIAYIFSPCVDQGQPDKQVSKRVNNRLRQCRSYLDPKLQSEIDNWRDGWVLNGYVTDADIATAIQKVYASNKTQDGTNTDNGDQPPDDLYAIRQGVGDKLFEQTYLFYKYYRHTELSSDAWGQQGRNTSDSIYDLLDQLHRIKLSLGNADTTINDIVDSFDENSGIAGLLYASRQIHVRLAEHYQEASHSKAEGSDDKLKEEQGKTLEQTKKLINRVSYRYTGRKYIYDLHHYFKCPYSRDQADFLQELMNKLDLNPDHVVLPSTHTVCEDKTTPLDTSQIGINQHENSQELKNSAGVAADTFSLIESRLDQLNNVNVKQIKAKLTELRTSCYEKEFKDRQYDIEARRSGYARTKNIKSYLTLALAVLTTAGEVGMQVNMAVGAMALFFSPPTAVLVIAGATIAVCATVSNFRLLRFVIDTAFNTFIHGLYSNKTGRRLNSLAQSFIGSNVLTANIVGIVVSGLSWYQGHGLWVNTVVPKLLSLVGITGLLALSGPIGHTIAAVIAFSSFIFFMSATLYSYIEVGSYLNERQATISSLPNIMIDMITGFVHSCSMQAFTEDLYGLDKGQGKSWSQASRQERKDYVCKLLARLTINVGVIVLVIGFPLMANTVELGASIQSLQGLFHNVANFLGTKLPAIAVSLTAGVLASVGVVLGDLIFDWNMMSKIFGQLVPSYRTLQNIWSTITHLGQNYEREAQQVTELATFDIPDNHERAQDQSGIGCRFNELASASANALMNFHRHPLDTLQHKIWPNIQISVLYVAAAINSLSYAAMTFTTWSLSAMGILLFSATGSASFAAMSFSINEDFSASEAPTSWSWRDKWGASPASENINSDDSASNDSIEQRNQITSTSGQSTTVADCYNTFWQEEKVKDNLQALESKLALRANMISSHD